MKETMDAKRKPHIQQQMRCKTQGNCEKRIKTQQQRGCYTREGHNTRKHIKKVLHDDGGGGVGMIQQEV